MLSQFYLQYLSSAALLIQHSNATVLLWCCAYVQGIVNVKENHPDSKPLHYNHSIVFILKKGRELCICIIYRLLNDDIVIDQYPIPKIDDVFSCLGSLVILNTIDLQCGQYKVALEEGHQKKLCFNLKYRFYEYTVL